MTIKKLFTLNNVGAAEPIFKNLVLRGNGGFLPRDKRDANNFPLDHTFTSGNITLHFPGGYYGRYRMWWGDINNGPAAMVMGSGGNTVHVYSDNPNSSPSNYNSGTQSFTGTLPTGKYVEFDFQSAIASGAAGVIQSPDRPGTIRVVLATGVNSLASFRCKIEGVAGTNGLATAANGEWPMITVETHAPFTNFDLVGSVWPTGAVSSGSVAILRYSPSSLSCSFTPGTVGSFSNFQKLICCMSGTSPLGTDCSGWLTDCQSGDLTRMFNDDVINTWTPVVGGAGILRFLDESWINSANAAKSDYRVPVTSLAYGIFSYPAGAYVGSITDNGHSQYSAALPSDLVGNTWADGDTVQGYINTTPERLTISTAEPGTTIAAVATATATQSGTNVTLTGASARNFGPGIVLTGTGFAANTYIVSQTSSSEAGGALGGAGVYVTNQSGTASAAACTGSTATTKLTISDATNLTTGDWTFSIGYGDSPPNVPGDHAQGIWQITKIVDGVNGKIELTSSPAGQSSVFKPYANGWAAGYVSHTAFTFGIRPKKLMIPYSMPTGVFWDSGTGPTCILTLVYNKAMDALIMWSQSSASWGISISWPIEVKIALVNKLGAAGYWHQFPFWYDTAEATKDANLVKTLLDPTRIGAFEFNNENWNTGFPHFSWGQWQAWCINTATGAFSSIDWVAMKIATLMEAVGTAWGGAASPTLKRILAYQMGAGESALFSHLFSGSNLDTTAYPKLSSVVGLSKSYNAAPNRPRDFCEAYSGAPYYDGGTFGFHGIWNPRISTKDVASLKAAVDAYLAGDTATCFAYFDNDIKQGTFCQYDVQSISGANLTLSRAFTCTISNGSPGVITGNGHALTPNMAVVFTTTGTLPAPLVVGTTYYVKADGLGPLTSLTANTFQIAASVGGAAINTTSAGSGTHTCTVGHRFDFNDEKVQVTSTGTLPTAADTGQPLLAGTVYYVRRTDANTVNLARGPSPAATLSLSGGSGVMTIGSHPAATATLMVLRELYYSAVAAEMLNDTPVKQYIPYESGYEVGAGIAIGTANVNASQCFPPLDSSYGSNWDGSDTSSDSGHVFDALVAYKKSYNFYKIVKQQCDDMTAVIPNAVWGWYHACAFSADFSASPNNAWAMMQTDSYNFGFSGSPFFASADAFRLYANNKSRVLIKT